MSVLALDLDGTLIDCRTRQVELTAAVLAELGAPPVDLERFWAAKQDGDNTHRALLSVGVPAAVARAAVVRWTACIEDARWLARDIVLATAPDALAAVRSAGLTPVVVTARRDASAVRDQVAALSLDVDDVVVVDPADAADGKAGRLRAIGAVGYVGDTEADARAAARARVPFVAVRGGQRSEAFLRAAGVANVEPDVLAAVVALLAQLGDR